MEQDINKVTDWLKTHLDKTIIVKKSEQDDMDQVHIKLSQVDLRQAGDESDDYLDNAIVLKGNGSTMNNDGTFVPLPQDTYDIVTTDLKITHLDLEGLELNTSRAKYIVSLA